MKNQERVLYTLNLNKHKNSYSRKTMGCTFSHLFGFFWPGISERELNKFCPTENPGLMRAMDLVKLNITETQNEMKELLAKQSVLQKCVNGLKDKCLALRDKPGYSDARRKLKIEYIKLHRLNTEEQRLTNMLMEYIRHDDVLQNQQKDARRVKRTIDLHNVLRESGMDAEKLLRMANQAQELQTRLSATTSILSTKQQAFANVQSMGATNDEDDAAFDALIDKELDISQNNNNDDNNSGQWNDEQHEDDGNADVALRNQHRAASADVDDNVIVEMNADESLY